jgi:hypothetical protein
MIGCRSSVRSPMIAAGLPGSAAARPVGGRRPSISAPGRGGDCCCRTRLRALWVRSSRINQLGSRLPYLYALCYEYRREEQRRHTGAARVEAGGDCLALAWQ